MTLFSGWRSCLVLFLAILFFDILSKEWVSQIASEPEIPSPFPYPVIENFFGIQLQITHAINSGAAWGVLDGFPGVLVLVRLLLISALIIYLVGVNHRPHWNAPLTCIIAGAIGNVIDYFHYGYVIDMIQFRFWGYDYPIFNLADSAIFIGSFWILCSAMTEKSTAS